MVLKPCYYVYLISILLYFRWRLVFLTMKQICTKYTTIKSVTCWNIMNCSLGWALYLLTQPVTRNKISMDPNFQNFKFLTQKCLNQKFFLELIFVYGPIISGPTQICYGLKPRSYQTRVWHWRPSLVFPHFRDIILWLLLLIFIHFIFWLISTE